MKSKLAAPSQPRTTAAAPQYFAIPRATTLDAYEEFLYMTPPLFRIYILGCSENDFFLLREDSFYTGEKEVSADMERRRVD